MSKNVVWVGPLVSEETMLTHPAVSAANNRWQSELIQSLSSLDSRVTCVSYITEQLWPKGRRILSVPRDGALPVGIRGQLGAYLNLPGLKLPTLFISLFCLTLNSVIGMRRPKCLVSYNVHSPVVLACYLLSRRLNIPWICILADPPRPRALELAAEKLIGWADGLVYLSYVEYLQSRAPMKLHMDGAVSRPLAQTSDCIQLKTLLFAGGLYPHTGLELLIEAFGLITDPDARLWVCGFGPTSAIEEAADRDTRIVFYGLVSEEELTRLSSLASVFVNPRPSSFQENSRNFPSKLLYYFRYGKPIVSTLTPGMAPEYESHLIIVGDESPRGLAEALSRALDMSPADRATYRNSIRSWVQSEKSWDSQASRLLEFIDSCSGGVD